MSAQGAQRPISPAIALGLVLVSALSLIAFLALSAYAPDLRDEANGDAHALSNSAIGFSGLRFLLTAAGIDNAIGRGTRLREGKLPSLTVLTPEITSRSSEIKSLSQRKIVLIILPKWLPFPDPVRPGFVDKVAAFSGRDIAALLKDLSKDTKIEQAKGSKGVALALAADFPGLYLPSQSAPIDTLQTISGPHWIPIITGGKGHVVLALLEGTAVFVLADPDLMNNHAIASSKEAAFAISFFSATRSRRGPVVFDVTLNGFNRAPDPLRTMFAPPFLGATICAILAALLIGFHAFARFGEPRPPPPGFALGKTALVDNTAELVRVMNREPRMAERYAIVTRNLVWRGLGIRRQVERDQADATLKALERRAGGLEFDALNAEAARVRRKSELMRVAGQLFRWRERIVHAR